MRRICVVVLMTLGLCACTQRPTQTDAEPIRATQAPPAKPAVAQYDKEHGDKQVAQMLVDRPVMARFPNADGSMRALTKDDAIWQWAAKGYGTKVNGSLIVWDKGNGDMPPQYSGWHVIPTKTEMGRILLREVVEYNGKRHTLNFEEMWSHCIFELINVSHAEQFMGNYWTALAGNMTRDQWIRSNTGLEYDSCVKLKGFFKEVWLPWCQASGCGHAVKVWDNNLPATYDAWIALYLNAPNNPYQYWQDYYDKYIVEYLRQVREGKGKDGSRAEVRGQRSEVRGPEAL